MDTYSGPMCELSTVVKAKFRDAMFDGIQRFINRADDHTWLANIFGSSFEDVEIAISSENITSQNIPIKPTEMVIFVRIVERFRGRPSIVDKTSERSARSIFFPILFAMDGSTNFPMTCRLWIGSHNPEWSGHPSTLTQCNTPFALKRVSDELVTAILMACNNRPKDFEIIEDEKTPPHTQSSDITQNFGSNAQSSLNVPTGSNDDDVYVDKTEDD